MEREIGEIFEYNGEWYQAIDNKHNVMCIGCVFVNDCNECIADRNTVGHCGCKGDNPLIIKKLENVGEPYVRGDSVVRERMFQKYRLYDKNFIINDKNLLFISFGDIVSIEIKQNKEDMEEKNNGNTPLNVLTDKYVNGNIGYDDFEKEVKALYSCKEESKPKLKPFDFEAAKAGKPVCTRDGRKARIICFDLKNKDYPIVAAIGNDYSETLFGYTSNGKITVDIESGKDLMMLLEKKEGWVNVYKDYDSYTTSEEIYESKEEAIKSNPYEEAYLTTVKIEWEE